MVVADSSNPLYLQVASEIQQRIDTGVYKKGEKMPTEHDLMKEYSISRVTVRKALNELESQNIIVRHQGKGTFVNNNKHPRSLSGVHSFSNIYKQMGKKPGAKVIKQVIEEPSEDEIKSLDLAEGELIVTIERIRYIDDEPVSVESSKFPANRYNFLLKENLNDNSMFDILKQRNIVFYSNQKIIELCYADMEKSIYLDLEQGYPLILISGVSYDTDDNPAHLWQQWIVGDKFKFLIE